MTDKLAIDVQSEIGVLEAVILHTPGAEVENMTPESAKRALYSDLLNLAVVNDEYAQFAETLGRLTRVFQVEDLLGDILLQEEIRADLLTAICSRENALDVIPRLKDTPAQDLACMLIQGVLMEKDNLTKYLDRERYALQPLHNFFFMRDAASVIGNQVMVNRMANAVREREALIMEAIMARHPVFEAQVFHPAGAVADTSSPIIIEGGDILVAREDILIVGQGSRTSTQGIDGLIEHLKGRVSRGHIIVQELPFEPESFIHLDMVFTLLDVDTCMVYKPLILDSNRFLTTHIQIDHGKVTIREASNIPDVLQRLGMPMAIICCGGDQDRFTQEREQWHSGANFFCLGPGKVMGYGRNIFTMEALSRHGFTIVPAAALEDKAFDLAADDKVVVTIEGTELARGGGGCRCMTMPVTRKKVNWP